MHIRLALARPLLLLMPHFAFCRLRTMIYRACGVRIGKGSMVLGTIDLNGAGHVTRRLSIGAQCLINSPVYFDLNAPIDIADHVGVGHHVVIITATHLMASEHHRCGPSSSAPVRIEKGAWIGARVTILPGVTIGHGSVIAAGAVVAADVPPNTLVGGVPAKPIRTLNGGTHATTDR